MDTQVAAATPTQIKLHREATDRRTKFFGSRPAFCDRQYLRLDEDRLRLEAEIEHLRLQKLRLEGDVAAVELRRQVALENEQRIEAGRQPTIRQIIFNVAKFYDSSREEILSSRRIPRSVRMRHIITWLAKDLTLLSYPEIGRHLKRDHSTLVHGYHKIEKERTGDVQLNSDLAKLKTILGA